MKLQEAKYIKIGTTSAIKVMLGDTQVWPKQDNAHVLYGEVADASQPLPTISLDNTVNTPKLDAATNMFYLDSWSNAAPTWMSFDNKSNIKSITKLKGLATSNVTSMEDMFNGCSSLTSLDLSNFNTSKATNMNSMFWGCSSLTSLDLSNFNTSKVNYMANMFHNCTSITSLDLSSWDTSNVNIMSSMFGGCSKLTALDLSSFNTSKVTNMSDMFYNCSKLTALDLSSFNTSKVTTMNTMFSSCSSLTTLNLSNWDTSKVTNMAGMFWVCSKLKDVYITVESTLNKLTNNLTAQGGDYIPQTATIHYNGVDYKWNGSAWAQQQ